MMTDSTIFPSNTGLGTYKITDEESCIETIQTALKTGYRHIDTAEAYGNESAIGDGVNSADIPRDEIFIATKGLHPRFTKGYAYQDIIESVRSCLARLDIEYVDLLYAPHWPCGGEYNPKETFTACKELVDQGLVDYIGVCNFTPELLDEAVNNAPISISVLQVEMHPLLQQRALRQYCKNNDIEIVAYAPLGNGRVLHEPALKSVAEEHNSTPAQVSLAWLHKKGVVPIPKASSRKHIVENWQASTIELDDEDVEAIDNITHRVRRYDPGYSPDW
jgi:2,5-diketo-D-gluconate reductase B